MTGCGEFWCDWVNHFPFYLMAEMGSVASEYDGSTWGAGHSPSR